MATLFSAVLVVLGSALGATAAPGQHSGKFNGRAGARAQRPDELPFMETGAVRLAYQLMDSLNPFPVDVVHASSPLAWSVAGAVGRATSLHPSCVYVHLVILMSLVLDAVQVKYGGILGKFSNPLMIQHGAPGDGKSIALWLVFQVLAYFDKIRNKVAKAAYDQKVRDKKDKRRQGQGQAAEEEDSADEDQKLTPPADVDSIFNKGTFIGLGQFLKGHGGVAYFGLHEGKTFMTDLFASGPGGGVEDLNQIMDHDLYKNHPANNQSKFNVRNVHVVGSVLMHLEEVERQARQSDSVAGLSRFLVGKFPVVVHKIMPDLNPAEVEQLLQDDPDYFNSMNYDDVVGGLANILFAGRQLFQKDAPPSVPATDVKKVYSKITGLHTLPMSSEVQEHFRKSYNDSADAIRDDLANLGGRASQLSKDKTRPLQFIAPVHLLEKTINFLLSKAGKSAEEKKDMDGQAILVALASVDSESLCKTVPTRDAIPRGATKAAVDTSVALAAWFARNFSTAVGASQMVKAFLADRARLAAVPAPTFETAAQMLSAIVAPRLDPASTLAEIAENRLNIVAFAQRPAVSADDVRAKIVDILLLAFMGFVHVKDGRCAVASFAMNDESFLRAANRLQTWCPDASFPHVRALCPEEGLGPVVVNADAASAAVAAMKNLVEGTAVDASVHADIFSTSAAEVALPEPEPPATQADRHSQIQRILQGDAAAAAHPHGLAQAGPAGEPPEGGPDRERVAKRLQMREEAPFDYQGLRGNVLLAGKIGAAACATQSTDIAVNKLKDMFKSDGTAPAVDKTATLLLQFLHELGLGTRSKMGKSIVVLAPPEQRIETVVKRIASMFKLNETEEARMVEAMSRRPVCLRFNLEAFDALARKVEEGIPEWAPKPR
ncbi:unnamed protein product [Prorocentrum cordatum]|uniref:Uncharacterized protein n=1 Tax=Prorocentrum cordatum TaxID=2364126 RepID=A0ABN9RU17_9DINO|nr:unnamed protein product [Polarella glacialis]